MLLSNKGSTLLKLKSILRHGEIPDLEVLKVSDFEQNFDRSYSKLLNIFFNKKIAIRSDHHSEDNLNTSNAGKFHTELNVEINNKVEFKQSLLKVIESYKISPGNISDQNIIFQEMVQKVICSGVIFTRNQMDNAPYFVINYDDESGRTDTITRGEKVNSNRILYVHHGSIEKVNSPRFKKLLKTTQEIMKLTNEDLLDIEFILDENLEVFIVQVRKLIIKKKLNFKEVEFNTQLNEVANMIDLLQSQNTNYISRIFAMMPDWNPVELIGRKPRTLAYDLFKKLITDSSWAQARSELGYNVVDDTQLVYLIGGTPYVDVVKSLHSLTQYNLPIKIQEKIIINSHNRLLSNPNYHDKYEFEIVISSPSFDLEDRIELIHGIVLNKNEQHEYKNIILFHFLQIFENWESNLNSMMSDLQQLSEVRLDKEDVFDYLIKLSNISGRNFAKIARLAFISTELLKSLVRKNRINTEDYNKFYKMLDLISNQYLQDLKKLKLDLMSNLEFNSMYGHLRPGTFDITQLPYFMDEKYYKFNLNNFDLVDGEINKDDGTRISNAIIQALGVSLNEINLKIDPIEVFNFVKKSIESRELAKFYLSKGVSKSIEIIFEIGQTYNLNREELSFSKIVEIEMLTKNRISLDEFRNIIYENKKSYELLKDIKTPEIINNSDSIYVVPFQGGLPNFISSKNVKGKVRLNPKPYDDYFENEQEENIIVLENADPGFDWIFSKNILGLITRFGGVNSHMAIRCAEFSVTAVIGCGEKIFNKICSSKIIGINGLEQKIVFYE